MKKINPQNSNNVEGAPTQPPIGFCFPCHFCGRAPGKRKDLIQQLNPFPLLPDLRGAYTISPLRVFWFPLKRKYIKKEREQGLIYSHIFIKNRDDHDVLLLHYSHETVHNLLLGTAMGYLTLLLIQFQYIAIAQALLRGHQIRIPSLNEPSRYLARAQDTLGAIEEPIAFIHELMAVTLPLFCAERGFLPISFGMLRHIHPNGKLHESDRHLGESIEKEFRVALTQETPSPMLVDFLTEENEALFVEYLDRFSYQHENFD
jgi:hypothetical protein